jgi:hypothetical protein
MQAATPWAEGWSGATVAGGVGGRAGGRHDVVGGCPAVGPRLEGVGLLPFCCGDGAVSEFCDFTMTVRLNGAFWLVP